MSDVAVRLGALSAVSYGRFPFTLVYADQRERRRRRRLFEHLERIDRFDGVPDRELDLPAV